MHGVRTHLGTFDTAKEAAIAFDRAAIQRGDSLFKLNFPNMLHKWEQPKTTKGVSKSRGNFRVRIMVDGDNRCLGTFATAKEGAAAYDRAAALRAAALRGETRWDLNFPKLG